MTTEPLKIGIIEYSLTLPLRLCLTELPKDKFEITYGTPQELNKKMLSKELDCSLMSSFTFFSNKNKFKRHSEIGIAATNEVMSIALFSRMSPSDLNEVTIGCSNECISSINLCKILMRKHWNANPFFLENLEQSQLHNFPAYLIIGNPCLLDTPPPGFVKYDLAAAWYEMTKLPFTPGVFASQKELSPQKDELVTKAIENMQGSLKLAQQNPGLIIRLAKKEISLPEETLIKYFKLLNFNLSHTHTKSIELFSTYLQEINEKEAIGSI